MQQQETLRHTFFISPKSLLFAFPFAVCSHTQCDGCCAPSGFLASGQPACTSSSPKVPFNPTTLGSRAYSPRPFSTAKAPGTDSELHRSLCERSSAARRGLHKSCRGCLRAPEDGEPARYLVLLDTEPDMRLELISGLIASGSSQAHSRTTRSSEPLCRGVHSTVADGLYVASAAMPTLQADCSATIKGICLYFRWTAGMSHASSS